MKKINKETIENKTTMVTDKLQTISLAPYGDVKIYHKSRMGKVQDIIDMANVSSKLKGEKATYVLDQALRSVDTWKYIIEMEVLRLNGEYKDDDFNSLESNELTKAPNLGVYSKSVDSTDLKNGNKIIADYGLLNNYKDKKGNIKYKELIKMFPYWVKSKKGRYGGTWAKLPILLKIAGNIDKAVEAVAYTKLLESNILKVRDKGGVLHDKLTAKVDTMLLNDNDIRLNAFKENITTIIVMQKLSTKINKKIKGAFSYGWDSETDEQYDMRVEYLTKIITFIDMGFITNQKDLLAIVDKL